MPRYYIVPTNEGQELNYNEAFTGSLINAKRRALELRLGLAKLLIQGTIGVEIKFYTHQQGTGFDICKVWAWDRYNKKWYETER